MRNKEYRPTLAQLRTFVTIAENKHFGTAATKLEISQPSLSQALAALERGLNVQLIERSTRKVIVTTAGEALLPYAKATLDAADLFLTHAHGSQGTLAGPLSIGIIPTIAPYILPHLLQSSLEEFPELEPRITEDQTASLLKKLREGTLDVAVMALPSDTAGLTEIPLYEEKFKTVTTSQHPLAGREDLTLGDIEEMELLLLDDGHCLRDQIVDLCRSAHISPSKATSSVTRASSLTTIIQLVVAGMGTTLIPESALKTELHNPNLVVGGFVPEVTASRQVGLVYRASAARETEFSQLGELVRLAFTKAIS
ncbi:LysR family transcriptional regulator [Corynebacterium phocae]|uniref:Probable hydrogen peroxide-inducible genes activator n=1 Tax=Corynebacterium phocae TaxID=161895 RepID=A0A1L7D2T9_9CORY|nr:hydrogen peroxide-inducible genes activator [Corynebacterium phocae]APT92387.1 LysR family transcriptional regulator [Corynebacterium phocae]KAA8724979.1 LysR family transcriptional regulator [Corynebacterium phocae]